MKTHFRHPDSRSDQLKEVNPDWLPLCNDYRIPDSSIIEGTVDEYLNETSENNRCKICERKVNEFLKRTPQDVPSFT